MGIGGSPNTQFSSLIIMTTFSVVSEILYAARLNYKSPRLNILSIRFPVTSASSGYITKIFQNLRKGRS
jgi:hypothetical protein